MTQSTVFISHSQKDEQEKNRLVSHLEVLERAGLLEVWSDDDIGAGSDWETEISQAIARAKVAILLITANFLTSENLEQEVPKLLERHQSEGLIILPVIARACAWRNVEWLAKMDVRPKNKKPVWSDGGSHVDKDLAAIAGEVADIIKLEKFKLEKQEEVKSNKMGENATEKRSWWGRLEVIGGLIVSIVTVLAYLGIQNPISPSVTPTLVALQPADFVVRVVQDDNQVPIAQVEVIFELENSENPQKEITNGLGLVRFSKVLKSKTNFVKISITDERYETVDRSITVDINDPIFEVGLIPKPTVTPTVMPSDTLTTTPTITPTNPPIPTPGETLTATLIPLTDTSTVVPTNTPTSTPPTTPTNIPTNTPVATPTPSVPTGRLAIPLMFGPNPKVYLVRVDGALIREIDGRQPDFTRDGDQLVVNGSGNITMLYRTDRDGNFLATVGDPGLTEHTHPAWSPDETQVIYDDDKINPPNWHIFRRDLNNNEGPGEELIAVDIRPILGPNPLYPLWATQDRFIFRSCNTWGDGRQCGLWLMQGNLGNPERLTENFNHIPTDVDGDTLVYVSQEAGDWNVYTLDLETKAARQLTFDPAADSLATISPDGNWVAFLSNREGRLAVWRVSIDGRSVTRMFDIPSEWGALREDGWSEEKLSWGP